MNDPQQTRPQFFACHFERLLHRTRAAKEIGAAGCWLLAAIVMEEDRLRYAGPALFYNSDLCDSLGLGSVEALDRVRRKVIAAGWLDYTPGGRRVGAGKYRVQVPSRYRDAALIRESAEQTAEQTAEQSESKQRNLLTYPSSCSPTNTPAVAGGVRGEEKTQERKPRRAKTEPESDPLFARFWATYPRRVKKPDAARAFAKARAAGHITEKNIGDILAAVDRAKRLPDWLKDAGQFIPYPASWLNARRWEDEAGAPTDRAAEPEPPRRYGPLVNDTADDYAPLGGNT